MVQLRKINIKGNVLKSSRCFHTTVLLLHEKKKNKKNPLQKQQKTISKKRHKLQHLTTIYVF